MRFRFGLKFISVLVLVGTLAACEDSESRAERYYQSGLALLEEGDVERALIEFRNVFNLDGAHREARSTYARVVREQGKANEAYGQYLRLVEQYPDDLEGRIALSEMSFLTEQWDEFERHSAAAVELAPEDPRVQAIEATARYRTATMEEDGPARDAAHEKAIALIADQPENLLLQQIEINGHLANKAFAKALDAIDRAVAINPDNLRLAETRLGVLAALNDTDGIEAQLRHMVETFPENDQAKETLIGYYVSRGAPDKAEAFLREIADPEAEEPSFYLTLLQLIQQERGLDATLAELDAVIPTLEDPSRYQAMRAEIIFGQGQRTEAIEALEAVIAETEPSDQQRKIKISLARMLLQTGNEVGARQLVEQVLAEDPSQVEALQMTAAWQIEADDISDAIVSLRTALDQAPQDERSMALMAQAYMREGNRDLARDFLSLAVDASNQAVPQTLSYARFLIEEERYLPAEQALVASLRQNRDHPALLAELGRTYLLLEDYARLRQVIRQLNALGTDLATKAAAGLQTALIEREKGSAEAIEYLEEISKDWDNALTAKAAVIKARIASGDTEGALTSAADALAEDPQDRRRRYLMAATQAAVGQLEEAEKAYRTILEEDPAHSNVWLQLFRVVSAQGDRDRAEAVLAEGLEANANAPDLLWARAGLLEKAGDIEGAIEVYEALYAENSNSVIISNNLASLLATHRDDEASLERAATVARRLRGMNQFAFRDTRGWIAFRQGDTEAALAHLEPAAVGLARDPQVQYHLGRVYEEISRKSDAIAQYERVIELAGPDDTRPFVADTRTRLDALKAE